MAKIKACYPLFGKCQDNDIENSNSITGSALTTGKLVDVDVKPNITKAQLFADDGAAEEEKEFVDADITVTLDELSKESYLTMFGANTKTHASAPGGLIIDHEEDTPNYGTFGYIYGAVKNHVKTYVCVVLHRTLWDIPEDKATTKGENITFETAPLTGKAYKDKNGQWRTRAFGITTLAAAKTLLKKMVERDTGTVFDTLSDGSGDVIIDAVDAEVNKLLAADIDAEDDNAEAMTANQNAITVNQTGDSVAISGALSDMESFAHGGSTKKWIALIVDTHEASILSVKVDNVALTSSDVSAAAAVNAGAGKFILMLAADELATAQVTKTLSVEGKVSQALTFSFTDTSSN